MEKQCNGRSGYEQPSPRTSPWTRRDYGSIEDRYRSYDDQKLYNENRSRDFYRARDYHDNTRDDIGLLRDGDRSRPDYKQREEYTSRDRVRSEHASLDRRRHGSRDRHRSPSGHRSHDDSHMTDRRSRDVNHERHTLPRTNRDINHGATTNTDYIVPIESDTMHRQKPTDYTKRNGGTRTSTRLPELGPWNRCASDSTLDVYPERHVRFAVHRGARRDVTAHPRDGCLLLGREGYMWRKYGTTFYVRDRVRQCKVVKREILRDNFSSFLYLPERDRTALMLIWHFVKSIPFVMVIWASILVIQASKCSLPSGSRVLDMRVNLGLTIAEMLITCLFITINVMSARDKFKRAEAERLQLEQVDEESGEVSAAEFRVWMYLLVAMGIFCCAFMVMFVVVLAVNDALGWSILTNGIPAAVMFTASRLTHDFLDRIIARIRLDHHKIVLFESLLHMGRQYWAQTPDQRRKVRENVRFFIQSLQGTRYFGRPDYIAYPSECQRDVITGFESGV